MAFGGIMYSDELGDELHRLRSGAVMDGEDIYPLWKSFLADAFAREGDVYIVTPFIDVDRMNDILHIMRKYGSQRQFIFKGLFTRYWCDRSNGNNMSDLLEQLNYRVKRYFVDTLLNNIVYPPQTIHAKYVAFDDGDRVELLMTSANFHANHFCTQNKETVAYMIMSSGEFHTKYMQPLMD